MSNGKRQNINIFPQSTQGKGMGVRKSSMARMMKIQMKRAEVQDTSFDSHSLLSTNHKNMTNEKFRYMINNK